MGDWLQNLDVASPCHESWDDMSGDERRRFCDRCDQHVYDLDDITDESVIEALMQSEQYLVFGPDTLAEARNRGYRHKVV